MENVSLNTCGSVLSPGSAQSWLLAGKAEPWFVPSLGCDSSWGREIIALSLPHSPALIHLSLEITSLVPYLSPGWGLLSQKVPGS